MAGDCITWYLDRIGRVPLLTPEQEISLGRAIVALNELEGVEDLNPEQKRIKRRGERAYKRMFESNLRLVIGLARKYRSFAGTLAFEDLISAGNFGLDAAVRKFDPARGYRFSTYAYWWIRQAVHREIQQTGLTIRLPIHQSERVSKVRRWTRDFQQEHLRTPTKDEICEQFKIPRNEIDHLLTMAAGCVSLQQKANNGAEDASEILDLIADKTSEEDVWESMEIESQLAQLKPIMQERLKPREQEVIQLRFFSQATTKNPNEPELMSMAEAGRKLGVSRERARQIEARALGRLRWAMVYKKAV